MLRWMLAVRRKQSYFDGMFDLLSSLPPSALQQQRFLKKVAQNFRYFNSCIWIENGMSIFHRSCRQKQTNRDTGRFLCAIPSVKIVVARTCAFFQPTDVFFWWGAPLFCCEGELQNTAESSDEEIDTNRDNSSAQMKGRLNFPMENLADAYGVKYCGAP